MFKNYESFCTFIQNLFDLVETCRDLQTIEITGYTRKDIDEITYQCIKSGYILNVDTYRDANGDPHFDAIGKPCISIAGYEFLNNLRSNVALKKAQHADIKGWISVGIAFLVLVWNVVSPFLLKK
jgi:hypothetical protein